MSPQANQGAVASSIGGPVGVVSMAGMAGYEQPNAYTAPQVGKEYLCTRSASMYRFIPVMRAVLVEETQGNSNGFLIRFLSSVSFGSAKTTTDRWHPAPGGSPSTARPRQSY